VVHPLDWDCAAVHAAEHLPALHVGEVAADRLGRHAIAAGEVPDVDRALAQSEHVDPLLAIVLKPRAAGL
jgi:hypothetical protein